MSVSFNVKEVPVLPSFLEHTKIDLAQPLTSITNTKLLSCQNKDVTSAYTTSPSTITSVGTPIATGFNPFDTDVSMVMGRPSDYCTLDQLNPIERESGTVISEGNLKFYSTHDASGYACGFGNIGLTGGRWYFEAFIVNNYLIIIIIMSILFVILMLYFAYKIKILRLN